MPPQIEENLDELSFSHLKSALEKAGSMQLKVVGISMRPILEPGELVTVESSPLEEIKRFDLVVFIRNGALVCHYFWRMDQDIEDPEKKFVICRSYYFRKIFDVVKGSDVLGKVSSHCFSRFNKLVALIR